MRTSLNEIRQIEEHLSGRLGGEEDVLFQAKLILDPNLADNTYWQQKSYKLIQMYGRRHLKKEIEAVHQKLFSEGRHSRFKQTVLALFR